MGRKRELQERIQASTLPADKAGSNDIDWAITEFSKRRGDDLAYRGYYDGQGQNRMISAERLQSIFGKLFAGYRVNMCGSVVDAVADRLQVASFVDTRSGESERANSDSQNEGFADYSADAQEIWERNHMHRRSGPLHQESIAVGNGYLLVWPGPDDYPVLYPQAAHEIVVDYDKERPGRIVKAAKLWREKLPMEQMTGAQPTGSQSPSYAPTGEKKDAYRLNLYYEDRVEKYVALKPPNNNDWPKADKFHRYDPEGNGSWWIGNEWNVVPIFPFANAADIGEYGVSELRDAVPIQDELNYDSFQLLVGVEFQAFRQRYVINIEDPGEENSAFETAMDRLWALRGLPRGDSEEGEHPPQVGQLDAADLEQMTKVFRLAAMKMAIVTGTPIHHFLPTAEGPSTPVSGESQKVADTKLNNRVKDRQMAFGDSWAAVMALAVRMKHGLQDKDAVALATNWTDTRPRNETEVLDNALKKRKLGVPQRELLIELGYTATKVDEWEAKGLMGAAEPPKDFNDVLDELEID